MANDTANNMPDDALASLAALPPAELDAWLRAHLTRQAVAILLAPAADLLAAQRWAAPLASYAELRLLVRALPDAPNATSPHALSEMLSATAPLEPDAALIWLAHADAPALAMARTILATLDDLGLRDRWLCLLTGPGATRALAHQLGYEDGLAPAVPLGQVAARLAHAAVANERYRRRGSSPPCYLE